MTTTDPAERRRIVRGAIECAIRLAPGTRTRQAAPLATAVWRVIEPQLAQRDAQLTAVGEVVTAMEGITGARFWAEQLRAALHPQQRRAAVESQPPLTWCGASMPGVGGEPIGPCVLRAGHDGPVHQAASRAKWWPTEGGVIATPEPMSEQEVEAFRAAWRTHLADHVTNGTICIHSATRVAEGLGEQPGTVLDEAADARAVAQAVTREQLHDAIRTLARLDRKWWHDELRRYERINHNGRFPR